MEKIIIDLCIISIVSAIYCFSVFTQSIAIITIIKTVIVASAIDFFCKNKVIDFIMPIENKEQFITHHLGLLALFELGVERD